MADHDIQALAQYLAAAAEIHASGAGVPETSYYPALGALLNAAGAALNPVVRCLVSLRDTGAGLPDGGFFTADQLRRGKSGEPPPGQKPARGALEVKGAEQDLGELTASEQLRGYWLGYGQVLITNLREFAVVAAPADGPPRPVIVDRYTLSEISKGFWLACSHPQRTAVEHGAGLMEFLKRALLRPVPLTEPGDVAFFLASYAREALARIAAAPDEALAPLRGALESSLGLDIQGEGGEHFFRSSLIQTLFYGVFSAWALWCEESKTEATANFRWREAAWLLRVPVLRKLFHELVEPGQLESLRLAELLDQAAEALNRVRRGEFFAKFGVGDAVQYFYEPFLEAFDPELRKDLGIWYTPREIVEFMVARVDTVLREELDIERGLADPSVVVLDPCCGTGSFLIEVLRKIEADCRQRGESALAGLEVQAAARERVFGFELLPAPFVIAHLQVGMLLAQLGAPLPPRERAAVYLTNALTGWEPPKEGQYRVAYAELEQERAQAGRVKREAKVLVVLGNPPYNAFAGVSPEEENGLVEPYKQGLISEWGIKKFNLDDLYVRFFRIAERRVAEMTGRGVVSFISNHSWTGDPSFVVMRKHLLASFDRFWIESLHGDRRISEYAPDGQTSETIFAVRGFSAGIRQGVATSLWVKDAGRRRRVLFRDDVDAARARDRRRQLLDSLKSRRFDAQYEVVRPSAANRFSFRPSRVAENYTAWPRVTDLCAEPPSNGLMEKRGGALISMEREPLAERMRDYFDRKLSWGEYKALHCGLTEPQAAFDPERARRTAVETDTFDPDRLVRYAVRPFDTRYCYYTQVPGVWNRSRPALWAQCWRGCRYLLTRPVGVARPEGAPMSFVSVLGDNDHLRGHAYYFPFRLRNGGNGNGTLLDNGGPKERSNLSAMARNYLLGLGYRDPDEPSVGDRVWLHVLAVGFAPQYLDEHADGIRQDWPHIPLPASRRLLERSAALGARVAALLDTEQPVGHLPPIGEITHDSRQALSAEDLAITAGWGHFGREGVVMPATGRLADRGESVDVYLNQHTAWRGIPRPAWEYTIGGYQVLKKWLSYREKPILGRTLTRAEAREFRDHAQRLAALAALEAVLNANAQACVASSPLANA